jgi:lipopolysaccharide heptosyltransferase II
MKILLIRFSSFGDVLQTLSVVGRLAEAFPQAEIHWVTREEFAPLISTHPRIAKVWTLKRGDGWRGLLTLGWRLRAQKFTDIYDAHNNLRSHVLGWLLNGFLGWRRWSGKQRFLRRSIYRWKRFVLFRLRKNLFPKPFSGQFALLEPLQKWGVSALAPAVPQLFLPQPERVRALLPSGPFIALAPSAAFPLKRWPLDYWRSLIELMPDKKFVTLGGPADVFVAELAQTFPERVTNLAGQLSLEESADVVALADALVSNDTGLMHVAEQIGKPCVALMGPAPFGFPSRPRTRILEINLTCRPCSKHGQGPCVNAEFQKCLRDIKPNTVVAALEDVLDARLPADR